MSFMRFAERGCLVFVGICVLSIVTALVSSSARGHREKLVLRAVRADLIALGTTVEDVEWPGDEISLTSIADKKSVKLASGADIKDFHYYPNSNLDGSMISYEGPLIQPYVLTYYRGGMVSQSKGPLKQTPK